MRLGGSLLIIGSACALTACETLTYYWQAVQGQWEIIDKSRPIEEVLAKEDLPDDLRHKLRKVQEIRSYAQRCLDLPVGEAYADYADLRRDAVVWNVVAAPEFSLVSTTWCFPVAGCVAYKGFFQRAMADAEAARLANQGHDVSVMAVTAYSTLGWFDDPVLSTFVGLDDERLTELLLHELAHRQFYLPGDTVLNESWATAVARVGTQQMVRETSPAALSPPTCASMTATEGAPVFVTEYKPAAVSGAVESSVAEAKAAPGSASPSPSQAEALLYQEVARTLGELETLYAEKSHTPGEIPVEEWRRRKAEILRRLPEHYATKTEGNPAAAPYLRWLQAPLNNARLLAVRNYQRWVPALTHQLLVELSGDWQEFYAWSDALAAMDAEARQRLLSDLDLRANPE